MVLIGFHGYSTQTGAHTVYPAVVVSGTSTPEDDCKTKTHTSGLTDPVVFFTSLLR